MTKTMNAQLGLEEADLIWYFGKAMCRFERSTFGQMIDRMTMLNSGSKRCRKCQHGIRWDFRIVEGTNPVRWKDPKTGHTYDTNECPHCRGMGTVSAPIRSRQPSRTGYRWCWRCKGQGEDDYGETCRSCGGIGYLIRQSAFRTRGLHGGAGVVVDDTTLQRSARISRKLAHASEAFGPTAIVMHLTYSDDGLRWAQRGRPLMAIYPVTRAGRKVCRGATQPAVTRGRLEAAMTSTESGTIALMSQALEEATELLRLSKEAYRAAV